MSLDRIRSFIIEFLTESDPARASDYRTIGNYDDLLGSGLVDSHRFIELCLALEEKTGVIIDIAELDPEQFNSIAGLSSVITRQAA